VAQPHQHDRQRHLCARVGRTDQAYAILQGEHVYPLVELSHTHMPTNYGGRERPNLVVKNWVTFGGGGGMPELPTPSTPPLTTPNASSPPVAPDNPLGMQHVAPLTAKEVTGDEIPF